MMVAAAAAPVGQTAAAAGGQGKRAEQRRWRRAGHGLEKTANKLERRGQDPAEPRQDVDQQRPPGAHGCGRRGWAPPAKTVLAGGGAR
jgi:hypothetical protein